MLKALSFFVPHFFYKKILNLREFIKEEKSLSDNISVFKKIWLWRNGFNSLNLRMFGLTTDNISNFLDNRTYRNMHPINGAYSRLLDNKSFLPLILPDYKKYAFEVFISVSKGKIIYTNQAQDDLSLIELVENLLVSKTLVCKPANLSGGKGFKIINRQNFREIIEEIINSKRDYVITEKIAQHSYSNDIFPDSVNTIRLLLMRDVDTHRLFIARGFHRFGTFQSEPVDNIDSGGVVANINLESGALSKILIFRNEYKGRELFSYYATHPDTEKTIEGLKIPRWEETKKAVLDSFEKMKWLVYAGIDVVLTEDSFKILEINSLPNVSTMQMFDPPLLTTESAAKFYIFYSKN